MRSTKTFFVTMSLFTCAAAFAGGHRGEPRGFPAGHGEALGPLYRQRPTPLRYPPSAGIDAVHRWNSIAVDASGFDHTPVRAGETRTFGEQLGPGRSSRAMAIVHIAIFDAVNAIAGGYRSYAGVAHAPRSTSMNAAVAQAAHDTLTALYPSQAESFDDRLAEDLGQIPEGPHKKKGMDVGKRAAAAILAQRAADGSEHPEPRIGVDFITSDQVGYWRQDPISLIPIALGAHWGECKPFVLASADQFRVPSPPALESPEYAAAFDEAMTLGGDGAVTPTERTAEETEIGTYWAYDGTPSLCAPPRLYNQIAVHIADQRRTDPVELARLLALVNVSMADAGIAIWESKYFYQFWRPVTGIRETVDPTFMPLGAPASNLTGPNFTPPFPSYPSGHAGFGAALFEVLRRFYGTDRIAFTFVSDEFNGTTVDNQGNVRPLSPRSFTSLSQAEEENGQSRIYLGIHWAFDKTEGIAQGRKVADYVFDHAFQPAHGH
jgi:membrane-associated phospholipid phosphatase